MKSNQLGAWVRACCAISLLGATACSIGSPPELADLGDQTAVVGQTLTLQLFASDPDGDDLNFRFEAAGLPDAETTTSLTKAPDGHGIFTFTPLASQVGEHFIDFTVSDGRNKDRLTIRIEVKGAVGDGSLPVYRKPLGSGTVLDLEQADCVDFEVLIEDPDSASVDLSVLPPVIKNSALTAEPNGLSGRWSWCPDRDQRSGPERYDLALQADDGDNPPVRKDFIIVLRKRSGADCPGEAPSIEHAPQDFQTALDLEISARVTDDVGLKAAPIVLYATEDPGTPVDFSKLSLAEMRLVSGDMTDGQWSAFIPNPTTSQGEGAQETLYYIISATDDDDTEGECDHRTELPTQGAFDVAVLNNGEADAGVCEPCSYDVQCGTETDLCLPGEFGGACGKACTGDSACGQGYVCSPTPVESVDGVTARQCVPNSGVCGSDGVCVDDDPDGSDDSPEEAAALGILPPGSYETSLCSNDEDWYLVELTEEAQIQASLDGDSPPDIDLAVTDAEGFLIEESAGLSSDEELQTPCLDPGQYFLRVYSISAGNAPGRYTLTYGRDPQACEEPSLPTMPGQGECCQANDTWGCNQLDVQTCVCESDDFCCNNTWDFMCAAKARDECGACQDTGGGDCCSVQNGPGCNDDAVQSCVCAADPWCCGQDANGNGTWDNFCVEAVGNLLCAPACVPDDDDGPCCDSTSFSPGCEINAVEECVCGSEGGDALCCDLVWDQTCVNLIDALDCGTCPG